VENIGIDVHKRESQICIITETGEILELRIATRRERFAEVLAGCSAHAEGSRLPGGLEFTYGPTSAVHEGPARASLPMPCQRTCAGQCLISGARSAEAVPEEPAVEVGDPAKGP